MMPLHQEGFDFSLVLTGAQFTVVPSMRKVRRCIQISMRAIATNQTTKRLLIRSVLSICIIAHIACLRGISTFDLPRTYAAFGCCPGELLRDMGQVGGKLRVGMVV